MSGVVAPRPGRRPSRRASSAASSAGRAPGGRARSRSARPSREQTAERAEHGPAPRSSDASGGAKEGQRGRPSVSVSERLEPRRDAAYERPTSAPERQRRRPSRPCAIPWSSSGSRITVSVAPTSRMISISCRRAWSTRVVAVVTVRMAARASTAPTPRPTTPRSRCQWARLLHPLDAALRPPRPRAAPPGAATSARAPSGVAPAAVRGDLERGGQAGSAAAGRRRRRPRRATRLSDAQRLGLARRSARAATPASAWTRSASAVGLGGRRLALEIDDDAHTVAPLGDGLAEVGREEPEAAERGQRERDQQDGADGHASGPRAQIAQRLADQESEHAPQPSSFTRRPACERQACGA